MIIQKNENDVLVRSECYRMLTVMYWRDDDGVAPLVRSRMNAINVLCTACTTTRISECYVHEVMITFSVP
jgi:hypothetical protein